MKTLQESLLDDLTGQTKDLRRLQIEEWLEENDLRYDYELYNHQLEENDVINQYSFDIRWR